MPTTTRTQNTYDHRLKEIVRSTGNVDIAIQRGVPASTARGWLTKTATEVITLDAFDLSVAELARAHSARDNLPPCRDGDPPEWDILSIDSAEVVCEERLGGVVKSFVRRAA